MNKERIALEVEEERQKQNQFSNTYHNPRSFSNIPATILYNETAILRENYNLVKAKKEEEAKLEKIIIEKGDCKEFFRWRKEMEEVDKLKEVEEIAKRKINIKLSKEKCVEGHHKKLIENKALMVKLKEEVRFYWLNFI